MLSRWVLGVNQVGGSGGNGDEIMMVMNAARRRYARSRFTAPLEGKQLPKFCLFPAPRSLANQQTARTHQGACSVRHLWHAPVNHQPLAWNLLDRGPSFTVWRQFDRPTFNKLQTQPLQQQLPHLFGEQCFSNTARSKLSLFDNVGHTSGRI